MTRTLNILGLLCLLLLGAIGGAGAQSPVASFTAIPNCALVLDANQPVYTTSAKSTYSVSEGDAVGCWADTSGGGHDALQATAANRATLHLAALGNPFSGIQSRTIRFGGATGGNGGTAAAGLLTNLAITSGGFTVITLATQTAAGVSARVVQGSSNWLMGPYQGTWEAFNGSAFTASVTAVTGTYQFQCVTQAAGGNLTSQVYPSAPGSVATANYPGTIGLGISGSQSNPANSDVAFVVIYTRVLSATEIAQVEDLIAQKLGYGGNQLAFYGNSLTYGTNSAGLPPPQINYATDAVAALFAKNQIPCYILQSGNPGNTSPQLLSVAAVLIDYLVMPTLSGTGKRIICVWEITNDINSSATPSAATIYANFVALCQHFKTLGYTVITLDCIPRTGFNTAQETVRVSVNASLAADFAGGATPAYADYLVKVSADTAVTSNVGPDGTHLTAAGYQSVANDVIPVIKSLLPTSVTFTSMQIKRGR